MSEGNYLGNFYTELRKLFVQVKFCDASLFPISDYETISSKKGKQMFDAT